MNAENLQRDGVKFLTFFMAARSCTTPFLTSSLASVSFLCTAISACPLRVHAFGETCGCRLSGLKARGMCCSLAVISQDAPSDFRPTRAPFPWHAQKMKVLGELWLAVMHARFYMLVPVTYFKHPYIYATGTHIYRYIYIYMGGGPAWCVYIWVPVAYYMVPVASFMVPVAYFKWMSMSE